MAAVVKGKCADAVPPLPGFVDGLFVLVLFPSHSIHLTLDPLRSSLVTSTADTPTHRELYRYAGSWSVQSAKAQFQWVVLERLYTTALCLDEQSSLRVRQSVADISRHGP